MNWTFFPETDFPNLTVRGDITWNDSEAVAEISVLGADPYYPLRAYGISGNERYYLGLMIPETDRMSLKFKRKCPKFNKILLSVGRMEDDYKIAAIGHSTETVSGEDSGKTASSEQEPPPDSTTLSWERKIKPDLDTETQQFLFAHPSTLANIEYYGHYAKCRISDESLYAFASSFGPHPLPHLAKYACWYDLDLSFGYRGYFIVGIRNDEFFLPDDTIWKAVD